MKNQLEQKHFDDGRQLEQAYNDLSMAEDSIAKRGAQRSIRAIKSRMARTIAKLENLERGFSI